MPKKKPRSSGGRGSKRKERWPAKARRRGKVEVYLRPGDKDYNLLSKQLLKEGFILKDVCGDGNCLFRAFAESLKDHHSNLRATAVDHIRTHETEYAPFVDDSNSFESYVKKLSRDGTYAGNDAIVALSRCYDVNVIIHQVDHPIMEVQAPERPQEKQTIHVAYLHEEHYCSVQPLHPEKSLPPLKTARSASNHHGATLSPPPAKPKQEFSSCADEVSLQLLLGESGCEDVSLAEQCLRENSGQLDLALVELLQLMSITEKCDDEMQVFGDCEDQQHDFTHPS